MGHTNAYLELILYQGRVQLATKDALYSDGVAYLPAKALVKFLKPQWPQLDQVLVLGTGLGSIAESLSRKGIQATFTLVELDKVVLDWAIERLEACGVKHIVPICTDAGLFVKKETSRFDLIFIDIFKDRRVPGFVLTEEFMVRCRSLLAPGGRVGFNYMADDPEEWVLVQELFPSVFENHKLLDLGINKVFVGW